MKLLGKNNDLYKDGRITKTGYFVMTVSSIFGFCCFLVGCSLYIRKAREKSAQHI